jgi:hypothetical protein
VKAIYLVLVIFTSNGNLKYENIPFINSSQNPVTCEEIFNKTIKYVNNPNYKEGNGEVWILIKYKDQNVIAHWCEDIEGNYVR